MDLKAETVSRVGGVFMSRAAIVAGPSEWKRLFWLLRLLESMARRSLKKAFTLSSSGKRMMDSNVYNYIHVCSTVSTSPLGIRGNSLSVLFPHKQKQ